MADGVGMYLRRMLRALWRHRRAADANDRPCVVQAWFSTDQPTVIVRRLSADELATPPARATRRESYYEQRARERGYRIPPRGRWIDV